MQCLCRIPLLPQRGRITLSGDFLIKRVFICLLALLMLAGFTVSAASKTVISPHGDFLDYQKDAKAVAEILNMDKDKLQSFCTENNIRGLWVNRDNTQQIRLADYATDFSNSVINISNFSDDKISELIPEISGIENAKGEIVLKGKQKFIKLQLLSRDSGGDYHLTQYITVANKEVFMLSFYTAADSNSDYIYVEKTFDSFDSPYFLSEEESKSGNWQIFILAAALIFAAAAVVIGITVIRDIRVERSAKLQEQENSDDSSQNGEGEQSTSDTL